MDTTRTTCKNCQAVLYGKYCSRCGEKVYTEHDKSILHLLEEGFHFVTHFEGTFFTTLKYLFTKPGKLSEDYCEGIRKPLFKPLSLFFLLVVIYLIFPVFEGLNMQLKFHLAHNVYGPFATHKLEALLQKTGWSSEQAAEHFHEKSVKVSKFLLLILLPLTALFYWPLTYKKRPLFFDQMVFATEINSMYLIWGFMLLPLLLLFVEWLAHLFTGHYFPASDNTIGPVLYLGICIYVSIAVCRFYQLGVIKSIGLGLLFYVAHYLIVQIIYKFLLFVITMALLH